MQNCMPMLHADDLYVHNMSDKSVRHVVLGRFVHSVVRFLLFEPNILVCFFLLNFSFCLLPCRTYLVNNFYRAMHFSAKRGIAIACRLSVRLSARLSVCLSLCNVGEL